jgi:hypothetical protein
VEALESRIEAAKRKRGGVVERSIADSSPQQLAGTFFASSVAVGIVSVSIVTVDVGFVKLTSDSCGNRVFKANTAFSSAVTCATVVL